MRQTVRNGVSLQLSTSGLPDLATGDPGRIRQILVNLIGNALKFTSEGAVEVAVSSQNLRDDLIQLTIIVRDTGIGISPEKVSGLFEAFKQADSSTSRRFGGIGLGLSISSRLTQAMGGAIDVESTVGVGSTFTVKLPLQRS